MVSVRVEFYGVLQEAAGRQALNWPQAEPVAVESLLTALASEYAKLEGHLPRLACAVNDSIVPRSQLVRPGDTLALLPPVSGG